MTAAPAACPHHSSCAAAVPGAPRICSQRWERGLEWALALSPCGPALGADLPISLPPGPAHRPEGGRGLGQRSQARPQSTGPGARPVGRLSGSLSPTFGGSQGDPFPGLSAARWARAKTLPSSCCLFIPVGPGRQVLGLTGLRRDREAGRWGSLAVQAE